MKARRFFIGCEVIDIPDYAFKKGEILTMDNSEYTLREEFTDTFLYNDDDEKRAYFRIEEYDTGKVIAEL